LDIYLTHAKINFRDAWRIKLILGHDSLVISKNKTNLANGNIFFIVLLINHFLTASLIIFPVSFLILLTSEDNFLSILKELLSHFITIKSSDSH